MIFMIFMSSPIFHNPIPKEAMYIVYYVMLTQDSGGWGAGVNRGHSGEYGNKRHLGT